MPNQPEHQKLWLWPQPLFVFKWGDYHEYKDNIVKHCYDLRDSKETSGVAEHAKQGLYESPFDFLESKKTSIRQLKQFINEKLRDVLFDMNASHMNEGDQITVDYESWCHITNDGGYHELHLHPMCSWCGIFYAQPGDSAGNNGVNRWFNPNESLYSDFGTLYQTSMYTWQPKEGELVIFPSTLPHNATPYKGYRDRVVISFNAKVYKVDE